MGFNTSTIILEINFFNKITNTIICKRFLQLKINCKKYIVPSKIPDLHALLIFMKLLDTMSYVSNVDIEKEIKGQKYNRY